MRRIGRLMVLGTVAAGVVAGAWPGSAVAARPTSIEGCIVERKPTSALMSSVDDSLFEVDLRGVVNLQFALKQDECVTVVGTDRDNEPGLRREFPQAGWLVEAQLIQPPTNRDVRPRREPDHDS